jgi:hypothetical protein
MTDVSDNDELSGMYRYEDSTLFILTNVDGIYALIRTARVRNSSEIYMWIPTM